MKRQREIILLLASIFIVSVAWIAFDLYHNVVTSTISQPLQKDIAPISPQFNTAIISTLQNRQYIGPLYTNASQPKPETATNSAQQTVTPTPTASNAAPTSITKTPSASGAAQTTGTLSPTP